MPFSRCGECGRRGRRLGSLPCHFSATAVHAKTQGTVCLAFSFELPGFPFANNLRVAAILESYAGTDPGAVSCNRGFARTRCAISSEFGVLVESYLGL